MKEVTIFKFKESDPYTRISNATLQDTRLSFKARGLLAYILSLPDDWSINVTHLETQSPQGKEAIYSALKELSELGYMRKEILRNEAGQIDGHRWIAFNNPSSDPERQKPCAGGMLGQVEPATTKEISEVKKKERNKEAEKLVQAIDVYNLYPRKVARADGLRAISKAIDKIGYEELRKHVAEYAAAVATWPQEQRGFAPYPASWINDERWNDDRSEWYRNSKPQQQKFSRPEYREMPTAN